MAKKIKKGNKIFFLVDKIDKNLPRLIIKNSTIITKKNIFKRIYLKEFNMTFDELFYHSMIVKNDDKFYKLKKKILNYYIKILTNFLILNFKKVTFYFARILAFYKFKAIR